MRTIALVAACVGVVAVLPLTIAIFAMGNVGEHDTPPTWYLACSALTIPLVMVIGGWLGWRYGRQEFEISRELGLAIGIIVGGILGIVSGAIWPTVWWLLASVTAIVRWVAPWARGNAS